MHTGESTQEPVQQPSALAVNIHRIRKARGLTQKELAQRLEVTATHINRLEAGAYAPSAALIPRLMRILEVTADELFREPREPTSSELELDELVRRVRALSVEQQASITMHLNLMKHRGFVRLNFVPEPTEEP